MFKNVVTPLSKDGQPVLKQCKVGAKNTWNMQVKNKFVILTNCQKKRNCKEIHRDEKTSSYTKINMRLQK